MTTFSANLGFLWAELPLPDAIRAAKAAGFAAVECHWPYDTPTADVVEALGETGLPMLGLNTRRGDVAGGDNGLCALPDRQDEARTSIAEAITYGHAIKAGAVHVMAGVATGPKAHAVFVENLRMATDMAAHHGMNILIEPLNQNDAPGYFLKDTRQAQAIVQEINVPNLKIMFDCYHVGRTEGDVINRLADVLPHIGHIQFASVPDRGAPDHGELDYADVFAQIDAMGWQHPLGAEYKPDGPTGETLGWMKR